jgi:hypothetical protein
MKHKCVVLKSILVFQVQVKHSYWGLKAVGLIEIYGQKATIGPTLYCNKSNAFLFLSQKLTQLLLDISSLSDNQVFENLTN